MASLTSSAGRILLLHAGISSRMSRRGMATSSAQEVANQLLSTFSNKTIQRRQTLDANQLQKLCLTLGRRELHPGLDITAQTPPQGTPLPQAYHLAYFTPDGLEHELGPDGTDVTFNAPAPFTRRMWAGGSLRFDLDRPLRVGDEATENTVLRSAVPKRGRDGREMVLVEVEKEILGPAGLAVLDRRSWVFRPEVDLISSDAMEPPVRRPLIREPSTVRDIKMDIEDIPRRQLCWSPLGLFRFSALTFNGHRIHYDEDWARSVEGHPGCIVHGPLNLISMLDYWRDHWNEMYGQDGANEITYRAISPLYAGDTYQIRAVGPRETPGSHNWDIMVEKDGIICMKADIHVKGVLDQRTPQKSRAPLSLE